MVERVKLDTTLGVYCTDICSITTTMMENITPRTVMTDVAIEPSNIRTASGSAFRKNISWMNKFVETSVNCRKQKNNPMRDRVIKTGMIQKCDVIFSINNAKRTFTQSA